jgi:hypothetical protein
LPIRVPEGPVDPYDPFPLDDASPAWNAAPIIRGRDAGFAVPSGDGSHDDEAGDVRFVEFVDETEDAAAASPPIVHEVEDDDNSARSWPEVRLEPIGDGHDAWAVVDAAEPVAPHAVDNVAADPWSVVGPESSSDDLDETRGEVEESVDDVEEPIIEPAGISTPGGPPLSSRAILAIGTLALVCLALAAALAFQAIGEEPPAMDGQEALVTQPVQASTVPPRAIREALPVSDTTLTGIERAAMGPLEGELDRLALALQGAFGRSSAEVAPVLQPYVAHAAERMRTHPARFVLVVTAPDPELAAARAEGILRAFEGTGLPADILRMTAGAGPPSVRFER